MIIREATENDQSALTNIYNSAVAERQAAPDLTPRTSEERQAWWQAHQDSRYPILVAEEAGTVQGYAALSSWVSGDVYAHTAEVGLYLAPDVQGRGLGTRLMQALLAEAARRGLHAVVARVWADNAASLALCRRCGFETIGVQPEVGRRRGAWEDCVVLQHTFPEELPGADV